MILRVTWICIANATLIIPCLFTKATLRHIDCFDPLSWYLKCSAHINCRGQDFRGDSTQPPIVESSVSIIVSNYTLLQHKLYAGLTIKRWWHWGFPLVAMYSETEALARLLATASISTYTWMDITLVTVMGGRCPRPRSVTCDSNAPQRWDHQALNALYMVYDIGWASWIFSLLRALLFGSSTDHIRLQYLCDWASVRYIYSSAIQMLLSVSVAWRSDLHFFNRRQLARPISYNSPRMYIRTTLCTLWLSSLAAPVLSWIRDDVLLLKDGFRV